MRPWNYLILLCLPAMVVGGFLLGGWWNFLVPVCCFAVYPAANLFLESAEDHAHAKTAEASSAYGLVALSFVPVLLALTAWSVYAVSKIKPDIISYAGFALSLGIVNSVLGFTLAHEFIHRFSKKEQVAGYLLLLQNNYMHYGIEHVRGHHVYACTSEDPHTAHIGESIYRFLPRAVWFTYRNACRIEARRISASKYKARFFHNRVIAFGALQLAFVLIIFFSAGLYACLFFLFQNAVAILLLHIINYMQHYGLMRNKTGEGTYERLSAHHAWNTGRSNNSVNLFQLENHADHHMHPGKSFEELDHTEQSPQYPAGYSFMVLLSLVPPLWFKVMDKRIPSNLINIQS